VPKKKQPGSFSVYPFYSAYVRASLADEAVLGETYLARCVAKDKGIVKMRRQVSWEYSTKRQDNPYLLLEWYAV